MKPHVVILGAGFAGHTAALHLSARARRLADITVIAPRNRFTWFPSLIWVATGTMAPEATWFELAPVYQRLGIEYKDGKATQIAPDAQSVTVSLAGGGEETIHYDYLINATGPYLNFEGTPGLGPVAGNSYSVCSVEHATECRDSYLSIVRDLEHGKRRRIVIGIGHPAATCEGAGFEYLMNVDADLRRRKVRDRADLVWLTNEPEPGDFGVDGIEARHSGRLMTGASVVRGLLDDHDIRSFIGAGVTKLESGKIFYDQVGAEPASLEYDFAMLIPQFRGIPLRYVGADGTDVSKEMTQANGFMNVDADYTAKPYGDYKASDWPATYRSPKYANVYAAGIAFAPPHPLSKPKKTTAGTTVIATVPRTGMASGIMGRTAALNIVDQIEGKSPSHTARMSEIPAACIASMGNSFFHGSAASIIMMPVARDYVRYPKYGRDMRLCDLDVGLAGAWTKRALHSAFLWKLHGHFGWQIVPE
jgi:sulfide:quinone oxidoreductase